MEIVLGCLGAIVLAVGVGAFEAWVFMELWNWIAVSLFSAPELSFWVAWGFLVLLNIIGGMFRSKTTVNKS